MPIRLDAPKGAAPVGTTYKTPDGYLLRIRLYDQDIDDLMHQDETGVPAPWKPRWDAFTPSGGATTYAGDLPEGSIVVIYSEATPLRLGSTFLAPDGDVYRLRDWSSNWDDLDGPKVPNWAIMLAHGAMSNARGNLPEGSRLIWAPSDVCKHCSRDIHQHHREVWADETNDPLYCTSARDLRHEPA